MGVWSHIDLLKGKVYEATIDKGPNNNKPDMFRIIDESGEDYIYPPEIFEIIEK